MSYMCGGPTIPEAVKIPPGMEPWCCGGAAETEDLHYCTCWEIIVDPPTGQQSIDRDASSITRASMCSDCAFRPGSPERASSPDVVADADQLEECVTGGIPFYCHDGLTRVVAYVHPTGVRVEAPPSAYVPKIARDGRPYRADGAPALFCAGWSARRAHFLAGAR